MRHPAQVFPAVLYLSFDSDISALSACARAFFIAPGATGKVVIKEGHGEQGSERRRAN